MKKRAYISLFIVFLCGSTVYAANELDYLGNDLDQLEEELLELDIDQEQLQEDIDYESTTELFPDPGSTAGAVLELEPEDQPSTTHVYTYIDGEAVVFTDVPAETWFAPYVRDMADLEIISGYKDADGKTLGLYGPADQVTIEQLAKIAVESSGLDVSECTSAAENPSANGRWSESYISCAEQNIWGVYAEATVDVTQPANRRDVVLTILEAFGRVLDPARGGIFKDVSNTMVYREAIETAYNDGIVGGYSDADGNPTGYFGPFDPVKRAEIAKIVSLALETYE